MAGKPVEIESAATTDKPERGYERSTIEFPYGDLNDAIEVAEAIHKNAGTGCSVEQLAGFLGQSSGGGAFRVKLSTTRIFGLVETEKGTVALTELGRKIVDSGLRRAAAAEAFLQVPLYKAVYEKYKGHMLPPAAAVQRDMVSMGVASKQAAKARQAFERSADQSGFFALGKERLVPPVVRGAAPPPGPAQDDGHRRTGGGGGGGGGDDELHPAIAGLLKTLPAPSTVWPATGRKKWLDAAENIFSLVYKDDEPQKGHA